MNKAIPKINTQLRSHTILVPEVYREATGVLINGKRIKSLVFSTDVAVIANCNADAVIAVYPFTPTIQITEAIISVLKDLFLLVLVVEQLPVNVLNRLL